MSKILRLDGAKSASGLSRSSIYNMMKTGDFPQSFLLGARAIGWLESDVQLWIHSRINDGFLTPFKVKRIKTTMDDYI